MAVAADVRLVLPLDMGLNMARLGSPDFNLFGFLFQNIATDASDFVKLTAKPEISDLTAPLTSSRKGTSATLAQGLGPDLPAAGATEMKPTQPKPFSRPRRQPLATFHAWAVPICILTASGFGFAVAANRATAAEALHLGAMFGVAAYLGLASFSLCAACVAALRNAGKPRRADR